MKKLITILLLFCFCVSAFGQSQQTKMFGQLPSGQYAEGLVFYWRGIPAGNAVDESLYGNHGTITGGVWRGQYLFMDGTGVVRTVADNPPITDWPITIITFGRVTTLTGLDFYFSLSNSTVEDQSIILRLTDGKLEGSVLTTLFNPTTQAVGTVAVGDHIMAAFVCASSTDRKLYLNGELVASDTDADTFPTSPTNIAWGGLVRPSNIYELGEFSGTLIYSRALSAGEIIHLYINPDLPMQQDPIWLLKAPAAAPSAGQVILITKAEQEYGLMLPWLMSEWLYPNLIQ